MLGKKFETRPGEPFTVDQLVDALLPDANIERAAANIQARVSELRRVLEPALSRGQDSQYILSVGEGYILNVEAPCWVDTETFTDAVVRADTKAEHADWAQAVEVFEEAAALYRGRVSTRGSLR